MAAGLALSLSACQTTDSQPAAPAWGATAGPQPAVEQAYTRPVRAASRFGGSPLLADTRGGNSTVIEGTGRFVGEPPIGSLSAAPDDVADGVTINLVNVPAPQAAKTILGDILSVRYTVDPGIEGKITIQTPRPVARSCIRRRFQGWRRVREDRRLSSDGAAKGA